MRKAAVRYGKRTAARIRAIRRKAADWKQRARRAFTLALVTAGMAAAPELTHAQMGQTAMAPTGGVVNQALTAFRGANENGPGWLYYGINAADRGLGYNGGYMTLGGFVPYAEDDLGGFWAADLRSHLSEYGGFFSNLGMVRKQFLGGTLFGVGVFWDYDADANQYPTGGALGTSQFGQFGHVYNQVGVSLEWLTDYGNLRSNGYIPVGSTGYTAGAPNYPFFQNFVMCQNGLDAALTGTDLEVGAYIPGLADWAGMVSVGGYAYGNDRNNVQQGPQTGQDIVPWFGGVYTRLDMTFVENWDFSLQANNDSYFDWTGFARLTYRMGGSRRRNVPDQVEQPMMRNEHIVRAHQNPIVALNPDNGNQPWRVIHVNNAAAPGGNGTAETPFTTLAQGDTAATRAWDIVFVDRGTGTPVGYDAQFSFNAPNQFLVGNGRPFLINTATCGLKNIATVTNGRRPVLRNPSGASIVIDGTKAGGAVVSTLDISGSATGIYATGDLSSGIPRSGPATATSYASPVGDTVISDVRITSTGAGQTGVLVNGGKADVIPPGAPDAVLDGRIRFYDTEILNSTLFGLRVSGESTPYVPDPLDPTNPDKASGFRLDYNGAITTSAAENIVFIEEMTGGDINVAVGNAPAGSTVPNRVTATGGGGIRLLSNNDLTDINIENVSLTKTAGNAIAVEQDSAVTTIRQRNGTGINRQTAGAAILIDEGAPTFTYEGSIINARETGSTSPSYLLSVQQVGAPGDIRLFSPVGNPFQDTGDGIFVSDLQPGAKVEVVGADITSSGANGILVANSSGEVIFRQMTIKGASTAGVALLQSDAGLDAKFQRLTIDLAGTNAIGFLAATNKGSGYNILVDGPANAIRTASTSEPAVSIEAGPANGAPLVNALFATVASEVASGGNNAMVFGPAATGFFTVSGSFTVAGPTPGTVANDVTVGGMTGVLVPP